MKINLESKKIKTDKVIRKKHEKSFTLIETIIALGLMVVVILEVASVQGKSVGLTFLSKKMVEASWYAKAIMSEIEYKSKFYPFKELRSDPSMRDKAIGPSLCKKISSDDCDFTYTVSIDDFKLPIVDIMLGDTKGKKSSDDEQAENPMKEMIKSKIKEILGDEVLKIAKVEVFWPEGAYRNSVYLTYLLTNQKSLDDYIEQLPPFKEFKKQQTCPDGQILEAGKCIIAKDQVDGENPPSEEEAPEDASSSEDIDQESKKARSPSGTNTKNPVKSQQ